MNFKKVILLFITLLPLSFYGDEWKFSQSNYYFRITDCIIRDIDNDGVDEVILSYFDSHDKYIDVFKVNNGDLSLVDTIKVPFFTVFFDCGDIDNDGKCDIVFLASDGLYYRTIYYDMKHGNQPLKHVNGVKSEIVVPQPELLSDVHMVTDLDGDGLNELIIENIRAIEIFETKNFSHLASIDLKTILEYALIPGQYYPHYIFYTLPIIIVKDLANDKKMEIVTKFPSTINIYSQKSINNWELKNSFYIGNDNVYFLSDSYVKFAFPLIVDIDNDKEDEIVVSSANLDLPRLRFEAIGDVYFFNKNNFKINNNKKIVVKGIPLNLPKFYNISNSKYKDFIIPMVPFNLISIFGLLSGSGSLKVPFIYYIQDENKFDIKHTRKLFEIPVRIENITSFIEELPLDQYEKGKFPDFYYFIHDFNKKTVDILYYNYNDKKDEYNTSVAETLSLPSYRQEFPSTLKLGSFSKNKKKDVVFLSHDTFFIISRK